MRTLSLLFGITLAVSARAEPSFADEGFKSIDFPTSGGFAARADVYDSANPAATWILLFHQAGWSRGEYREIAPKLVDKGYRVMAVDQRSGRAVNGVRNETHRRAVQEKLGTDYLDAYGDLQAALTHVRTKLGAKRVVVWGSSYSASLVLRLAAEHPSEVSAVVSFSPDEYFQKRGASYVKEFAKRVNQPLFATSSKDERPKVQPIFDVSPSKKKILFTPASKGQHGSRALWAKWPDSDVYWAAVNGFLSEYAPPAPPPQ
jgi:pimeloyl-ACP methyl ester carboxylesterase